MAPVADEADRAEDYQPYIPSAPSSNSYNSYDYGLSNLLSNNNYDNSAYGYNSGNSGSYVGANFGEDPISSYGYVQGSRGAAPDAYAMWEADFWRHWDGKQHTEDSTEALDRGVPHNNMDNYANGAHNAGIHKQFADDTDKFKQGPWASAARTVSGLTKVEGASKYDKSWELGDALADSRDQDDGKDDDVKLKCKACKVDFQIVWTGSAFAIKKKDGTGNAFANNAAAIATCDAAQTDVYCEYSAGVCFVEERMQFGLVTSYERGCKQAKACYMQKYQNFLVKAGRQCWPESNTDMIDKIARRPYDIMADEQYNTKHANAFDTTFTDFDIKTANDASDDTGGLLKGLYIDPDYVLTDGEILDYNSLKVVHGHAGTYSLGMKETSRCTQCCSKAHNCNDDWTPTKESEWAKDESSA